jgi:hypothetical protein
VLLIEQSTDQGQARCRRHVRMSAVTSQLMCDADPPRDVRRVV